MIRHVYWMLAALVSVISAYAGWQVATLIAGFVAAYLAHIQMKSRLPDDRPVFSVTEARRQAHGLGLPFVEADGSVTWPERKPTAEEVHRELHARRWEAERAQIDAIAKGGPTGDQAFAAWAAGRHIQGCWCDRGLTWQGIPFLYTDSRCRALRQKL